MAHDEKFASRFLKQNKGTLIPNNSIKYKIFWLGMVFECVFIFLFSHHQNITFYFWNMGVQSLFPSSYPLWENQIRKQEKHNYPCVQISYLTSRKGFGVHKKRVISYSKTTILTYFDKLKKKQQDRGGKYFYISIRSKLWSNNYSTISNLRETTYSNILVLVLFWKY